MAGLFEIVEITSSDENAVVVSAKDRGALAGRRTTLKVLKEGIAASISSRMRDEARVLSRLRHPAIVHLFGLHSYRGRPVLEMEFLRGLSGAQLVDAHPSGLPAEVVVGVGKTVASALDAAYHQPVGPGGQPMQIVHRNVSLPNLLVTVGGAVKVIDFIMAKGSYADRTAVSFVAPATSRGYPAPELQDPSSKVLPATDVYSLGHCLYHMASGRRMNLLPVEHLHESDAEKHLSSLVIKDLPADLGQRVVALIRRMVRFDASKRPSHREVATELSEIALHAQHPQDLASFGERVVMPAWEAREMLPSSHHPEWPEVAFLEELLPDIPDDVENLRPSDVEKRMRDAVKSPGWASRLDELQDLVVQAGHRPVEPFLPTLDRATIPAWKFWERPSPPADVCAALAMVVQSGDPQVLARAKALRGHRDADVRRAAEFVVAQFDEG